VSTCCLAVPNPGKVEAPNDDVGLNITEYVPKHGYPLERHDVQTEDGFVIEVQRIPHGRNNNFTGTRPSVLLMHGLFSSSIDWVNSGPEKGLGFFAGGLRLRRLAG